MDDFDFIEDDDLDINAMFDNQDDIPLDDEFIRTHFNTIPDGETIQNFPFVEDDIDAITDYELFSKGFGYLDDKKADKEELSDYAKKSEIPDVSEFVTKDTTDLENYTLTEDLSEVAISGSYDDLTDKPVIPDVSNYVTKDTTELENYTLTSDLSEVALTGDYDDLSNKPTIPVVPTNISSFTNDSGYITKDVNDLTNYTLTSSLSSVATTGNYNDLTNKPTIPTKTSDLTNDSGFITKSVNDLTNYTLSSSLSTVATSGSYNDLSNKPTIPDYTVGSFTPTILGLTTAGTATYTTQEGRYIKIGNVLHIEIKLTCKLEGSSGYIGIRGFPTNLGTLHDAGICNVITDLTTSNYPLFARVYYTQNLLLQYGNGGAYNTGWSTNKNIYLCGTFILN